MSITRRMAEFAHGLRTNAPGAALMNSLLVRALDYNDIFWEQDPSHPSDLIFGAVSPAEALGRDGRETLVAIVIAYELELRWCLACFPGVREIGWHHASLTQFVSPFVAGRIYGLDVDRLVAAAGISGSSHFTLGGVVAGHLTNMKNTADPLATQAGVLAALMAREGYEGPVEVIEGKEGFQEVIRGTELRPEVLLDGLGERFLITRCGYKPFPTEALTHQPMSAVLAIMQEHGLVAEEVARIRVRTTTRGADIQDNSGVASSFYHTSGHDVSGYSDLEVEFWYMPVSMDRTGEDFWVQYRDGAAWQTVAVFDKGVDFENGNFYNVVVQIPRALHPTGPVGLRSGRASVSAVLESGGASSSSPSSRWSTAWACWRRPWWSAGC